MKKLCLLFVLLIIANLCGFYYLRNIISNKNTLLFIDKNTPLIYKKKELILNSIDDFVFEEFFEVLIFNEYSYDYEFDDDLLIIKLKIDDINYDFKYNYSLTEPKIIEKEIIKEVYIESNENNHPYYEEEDYFNIACDSFCFSIGTDISEIIANIAENVETNIQVTIDYSQLNPNVYGQYKVIFNTNYKNYEVSVKII